jgi:hypothetical protein
VPESDYLEDAMHRQWCNILKIYRLYEKKKPIMLFDIQEERIYVYPYIEFRDDLSERSRLSLTEQYEEAIKENKLVVFVRDNEQKRLVSFSMPLG